MIDVVIATDVTMLHNHVTTRYNHKKQKPLAAARIEAIATVWAAAFR